MKSLSGVMNEEWEESLIGLTPDAKTAEVMDEYEPTSKATFDVAREWVLANQSMLFGRVTTIKTFNFHYAGTVAKLAIQRGPDTFGFWIGRISVDEDGVVSPLSPLMGVEVAQYMASQTFYDLDYAIAKTLPDAWATYNGELGILSKNSGIPDYKLRVYAPSVTPHAFNKLMGMVSAYLIKLVESVDGPKFITEEKFLLTSPVPIEDEAELDMFSSLEFETLADGQVKVTYQAVNKSLKSEILSTDEARLIYKKYRQQKWVADKPFQPMYKNYLQKVKYRDPSKSELDGMLVMINVANGKSVMIPYSYWDRATFDHKNAKIVDQSRVKAWEADYNGEYDEATIDQEDHKALSRYIEKLK